VGVIELNLNILEKIKYKVCLMEYNSVIRRMGMLESLKGKNRGVLDDEQANEASTLLIQLGRIEEKIDNLSNKISFEHGHIKEDTGFSVRALRDMSPTLVELENLKKEIMEKVSGLEKEPAPQVMVRGRGDKIRDGIVELMMDGAERSVTDITNRISVNFPEYKNNSLRVVVSRKLNRLVSEGRLETSDSKNKKLYCRKV